ncbi:MAG TPA: FAD/NAD(P)-binding protein [Geminicoccus sp.]|uniref:FAD/NAD(P)-binding protein n=1 Tax=Geminicoccus sp. TaxID=2024832 RepID=UPI002C8C5B8E|nr:FAD/NAD(P)-binding protein [Geminicoccus sp.]HWL70171.1 FAD/NAD(P)-binding protein [Geminicoccus sp.]
MTEPRQPGGPPSGRSIAIIGGGFSGTITALQLLRRAGEQDRVILIERNRQLGRGVAFATDDPNHVLNVRAENMSAFPDEPGHLLRWLEALPEAERAHVGTSGPAGTFVRRGLYGRYVRDQLAQVLRQRRSTDSLAIIKDEAQSLARTGQGWQLRTASGRTVDADTVILALGNFPPAPLPYPGCVDNPWQPQAIEEIDLEHPVLLLGAGLTMVDVTLRLLEHGFRGRIHALSRRGLLPHAHAAAPAWRDLRLTADDRRSLTTLMRGVRREVARAAQAGIGWRSVVDALRPHTQLLWQELSLSDRQRFLRHLRPWWDAHRHRIAPQVASRIEAMRRSGRLVLHSGKLQGLESSGPWSCGSLVTYRPRRSGQVLALEVQRVINCTGIGVDLAGSDDPLVRQLLQDGLVRPDRARLGLDATTSSMLIGRNGDVVPGLFGVGPIVRGTFWEMVAVPDIRTQAAMVARTVMERRPAGSRAA